MFTQTIIPKSRSVTIQLPDSFISKEVKVIAIVEKDQMSIRPKKSITDLKKEVSEITTSLKGFKFDRNEANDYE
jgi:hypothetical protein